MDHYDSIERIDRFKDDLLSIIFNRVDLDWLNVTTDYYKSTRVNHQATPNSKKLSNPKNVLGSIFGLDCDTNVYNCFVISQKFEEFYYESGKIQLNSLVFFQVNPESNWFCFYEGYIKSNDYEYLDEYHNINHISIYQGRSILDIFQTFFYNKFKIILENIKEPEDNVVDHSLAYDISSTDAQLLDNLLKIYY